MIDVLQHTSRCLRSISADLTDRLDNSPREMERYETPQFRGQPYRSLQRYIPIGIIHNARLLGDRGSRRGNSSGSSREYSEWATTSTSIWNARSKIKRWAVLEIDVMSARGQDETPGHYVSLHAIRFSLSFSHSLSLFFSLSLSLSLSLTISLDPLRRLQYSRSDENDLKLSILNKNLLLKETRDTL